ncbi:hypothetical protein AB0E10_39960 [Streptomyces sp. NPDC048045]|uniref:hypothetical protein n=1 Tax=Streptomyces sp. NPDC048045 TaxID=3154710 RepID=UPI00343604A4
MVSEIGCLDGQSGLFVLERDVGEGFRLAAFGSLQGEGCGLLIIGCFGSGEGERSARALQAS